MTPSMATRVAHFQTTIFAQINALAEQYDAINLGQGAPDFETPRHVIEAAQRALATPHHQYAPGMGYPELRKQVADHAKRFYMMDVNPDSEVVVTNGATEALFASILGLINPGDEVILIEPFYDSYLPAIEFAGGVPRYIPLHDPDWHLDFDELTALFNEKTRAIMLNTPHNPTGKVFSYDELSRIAALCQQFDVLVITDEVYEHILFDDARHIRMATLPGMAERTVTISSLGKTFTATGWKIGWAMATSELITGIFRVRQFISFAVAAPLQWAAIDILNAPDTYFTELKATYQRKRDFLVEALQATPLQPLIPQGGYFVMADVSALGQANDRAATEYLVREIGVATIPPSAFYSAAHTHLAHHLSRFSICKRDDTLHAAAEKLQALA